MRAHSPVIAPNGAPVVGFAGWSGSGKTALLEAVIALLAQQGLALAVVKHAHHMSDIDHPGKDSWRHRKAGAGQLILASPTRWAYIHENPPDAEPDLWSLLAVLAPCDLILVEGYKRAPIPKIEVWRGEQFGPPLWPNDPWVVAVAVPDALAREVTDRPVLPLDRPAAVADAVQEVACLRTVSPLVEAASFA